MNYNILKITFVVFSIINIAHLYREDYRNGGDKLGLAKFNAPQTSRKYSYSSPAFFKFTRYQDASDKTPTSALTDAEKKITIGFKKIIEKLNSAATSYMKREHVGDTRRTDAKFIEHVDDRIVNSLQCIVRILRKCLFFLNGNSKIRAERIKNLMRRDFELLEKNIGIENIKEEYKKGILEVGAMKVSQYIDQGLFGEKRETESPESVISFDLLEINIMEIMDIIKEEEEMYTMSKYTDEVPEAALQNTDQKKEVITLSFELAKRGLGMFVPFMKFYAVYDPSTGESRRGILMKGIPLAKRRFIDTNDECHNNVENIFRKDSEDYFDREFIPVPQTKRFVYDTYTDGSKVYTKRRLPMFKHPFIVDQMIFEENEYDNQNDDDDFFETYRY